MPPAPDRPPCAGIRLLGAGAYPYPRDALPGRSLDRLPGKHPGPACARDGAKGCMLVTVDDHHEVKSVETRWLDVMRWETCQLDASGARDGEEVVVLFRDRLAQLVASCDDRLLALRVDVSGSHRPTRRWLRRRHTGPANSARRRSTRCNCRVWVEKVFFRTSPPRRAIKEPPGDSPLHVLEAYLAELRADETQLLALRARALDDLTRKLPPDLVAGLDSPIGCAACSIRWARCCWIG